MDSNPETTTPSTPQNSYKESAGQSPAAEPRRGNRRRGRRPGTPAHDQRGDKPAEKRRRGHRDQKTHSNHPGDVAPSVGELYGLLDEMTIVDEHRFRRQLRRKPDAKQRKTLAHQISAARADYHAKDSRLPDPTYPEQLPVSARHDDILAAIRDHQVVVIAGETGSGKTTQIPKMCLELGRGRRGLIGHTQPRRLAARTVAERIADELGENIGSSVGYAIRFDDKVSKNTAIKLMTDGILLAEMTRDRYLNAYDTIIIDEAHERSLNIDFLLGYLKEILPKRPDLKVIVTSATIDPERFAHHFADADGNPAPIIEVSGRTYPVEVRYRPLVTDDERGNEVAVDMIDGLIDAVKELMREGHGDILCFFAGEADIRDAQEALEGLNLRGVDIHPLFGRLSNQDQHRVFRPSGRRRIVLATNIAETSLTVPGIHYVVDTGLARISRYSSRTKVQRLPVEPISQASAQQRSGRCGRVADGIAIRLYSEEDFLSRPEFTDPEILRTSLASVILKMAALRLGDIAEFPFIEPPETKQIRDGLLLLHELGALGEKETDAGPELTQVGRILAHLPLDPRMARMLIEAHTQGVLLEVIIIVSGLTIVDPRERPLEFQAQADQQHARFADANSDFLALLNLWRYIVDTREELTGNQFRKRMAKEYLHYLRIREWFDLVRQLTSLAEQIDFTVADELKEEVDADRIHQSILSGLLSHIGMRIAETREYQGSRSTKFMIFPGTKVAKKLPPTIMAAELVETSRLWARGVARINPQWVEKLAPHLLRHNYSEPHWSTKKRAAMVYQKSTLYGIPIVVDRLVPYHRVDAHGARTLFIRHALIAGEWQTHHEFFHTNRKLLEEAAELEDKARRRDIVVDEDTLFDFYDRRLPENVTTGALFDQWWKKTSQKTPDLLTFDPAALIKDDAETFAEEAFPDLWRQGTIDYELSYHFEPGAPDDGVSVLVPVPLLGNISEQGFDWLVPGVRQELVTELIRTLPKHVRRTVVPAPEFAAKAMPYLKPYASPLVNQLADALRQLGGSGINPEDFDTSKLPAHLTMTFAAIGKGGKLVDRDKDLNELKKRRAGQISSSLGKAVAPTQKKKLKSSKTWDPSIGEVPEVVTTTVDGQRVDAFPGLTVSADGVDVVVYPTKAQADAAMLTASLTLLARDISVSTQQMLNGLPLKQRVAVEHYPHGGSKGLVDDARIAAIRDLMLDAGGPVRSLEEFAELKKKVAPGVPTRVRQTVVALAPGLVDYLTVVDELKGWEGDAIDDMRAQLEFLLPPHAVSIHGVQHLRHLPRYFAAMKQRLEDMERNGDKDAEHQETIEQAQDYLAQRLKKLPAQREKSAEVKAVRWMIEELRVSLFAQRLGTTHPVSLRRIQKAVDKLR